LSQLRYKKITGIEMHRSSIYKAANRTEREELLRKLTQLSYPKKYKPPYTEIPFGEITGVWAEFAMKELTAKSKEVENLLSINAQNKLKESLVKQLSERSGPTLAALLHLAKMEKRLKGNTPKERYLYFIEKILGDPKYLHDFFSYFPPLAAYIASAILLWIDQVEEFLLRFKADSSQLRSYFSLRFKEIEDLSTSLSDLHHGNRSVYRLIFENGSSLIYKPKSLGLDKAYNEFIKELNQMGLTPKLQTYKILDRDSYGWVEFIETLPCSKENEVKRYFQRFGMLIALMYILEGTDCHYENMICSGEHPVLIDLESLFHPTIRSFKERPELTVWNHSVFRTGFLPGHGPSAQRRIDISPLSAEEEQQMPQETARWQDVNTDLMQFAFEKRIAKMNVPRPKIGGKIVSSTNYIKDLVSGFKKMYLLFSSNKKKVTSQLENLFNHPVRCIFRPTGLYSSILQRLTDPKLLRSETEVLKTIEILSRFSAIKEYTDLDLIIEKEKEALLHGDIPFFLSAATDNHIYYGKKVLAKNCFKSPAKKKVVEKIKNLNGKDLKLQLEYIDHSLYFLRTKDKEKTYQYKSYVSRKHVKPYSEIKLIDFAEKLGKKVLALSQPLTDGSLSWIALELDPTLDRLVFQPISQILYSGYAGIALFFAALGKIGGNKLFVQHAENLLKQLKIPFLEDPQAALLILSTGGMSGLGGLIYTFETVGRILGKKQYVKEASFLASLIDTKKIEEDRNYDIVLGSAGLILALLSLYDQTKEKSVLDKAKSAGRLLLEKAQKMEGNSLAWPCSFGEPLCGFSHGVSGIAYALFKLAKISKAPEFKKGAEQALLYERRLYSLSKGNWPDLRNNQKDSSPFSWCHGAPGIALSRLYSMELYPDPKKRKEAALGLKATQEHLVGGVDHLCCGTFGRIAILWDAGILLKDKKLQEIALKETAVKLDEYIKKGTFTLFYGLPEKVESPSFMTGLSGIGYFLLRLTQKGKTLPEVLIME